MTAGRAVVRVAAALAVALLAAAASPRVARAQSANAQTMLESSTGEPHQRYHSPRHFGVELAFGPYRPNVDSEFDGSRQPYANFFGSGRKLFSRLEVELELFHRFGTAAVGLGAGYFSVSGPAPEAATGSPSGDTSRMKVVPFSLSGIYRFDYLLERRGFPVVPYGKLGLDWAYWQITDGNDEIAKDGIGGTGRGGTLGWHAAAGVALVLDWLDPEAARDFDADLGVNHTSLTFELRHADISGLGESNRLHVGDTTWTIGLLFQF